MHLNKNPKLFQSTPKKYYNLPQQLKKKLQIMIKNEAPRKQNQNKTRISLDRNACAKGARARAATMAMSVYTDRPTERPANRAASIQVPNQVTKFPVQVQIQVPKLVLNQAPPWCSLLVVILTWSKLWQKLSLDPLHWWICALINMQYNFSLLSCFP